jgi:hypothetical protein
VALIALANFTKSALEALAESSIAWAIAISVSNSDPPADLTASQQPFAADQPYQDQRALAKKGAAVAIELVGAASDEFNRLGDGTSEPRADAILYQISHKEETDAPGEMLWCSSAANESSASSTAHGGRWRMGLWMGPFKRQAVRERYGTWSGPRPGGLTLRLRDSWRTEVRGWSSLALGGAG